MKQVDDPTIIAKLADLTAAVEAKFDAVRRPAAERIETFGFGVFELPPESAPVQQYNVTDTIIWKLYGRVRQGKTEQATEANISEECARLIDQAAKADIAGGPMLFWRQLPQLHIDYDFYTREIQIQLSARAHVVAEQ